MNIINKIVHIINRQSPSIGDPKNVFTNVAVWSIACLAFAATSILSATAVYADYTISMTTSGAHSVDVKPGAGGETGTSISEDAITVTTTCPNGYNLTLSTSVNDNNLYLGGDSSNNTAGTYFTPADGTTALSNAANTWGYYYESNNSNNTAPTKTSIFNPVPVKGSATTIKASTSTSDSFSVYYGVAVSSSMTPGTYKMIPDTNNAGHDGAIVYQLTMSQSCLPYTVIFNPTSTAGGTTLTGNGTMSDQIIPADVATALNSNTFTAPTGYEFDSWNTAQDGTGTSYTDGQSVTGLTTGGTSITLYAQWKTTSIYMQEMSFNECTTTPKTLYDKRDNQAYTVAKLADGECWMTTNLNLAGGTKLDSDGSDVPAGYTQSNPYYTLPASSTSGFSSETTAYVYNSGNTTNCGASGQSTECYSYYSWLAATAGGKDSSGSSVTSDGYNAAYSICPKGWTLPTATTSNANAQNNNNWKTGDFYALATAYGANLESSYSQNSGTFYNNAGPGTTPNFLLAGYYISSSFNAGGTGGNYWSSTSNSSNNAYNLNFRSDRVISASNSGRKNGFSVRCLKEKTTMQSVTYSDLATLMPNEGDTTTLPDARDGQEYTIAKLADGNYWMTTNLNLAGGTTLNASDSDVPSGNYYTLPASSTSGFSSDTTAYVYNSGNTTNCGASGQNTPCYSYYSWLAATAGGKNSSGSSVASDGYNATYSICPKGWRLPAATTSNANAQNNNDWKTGDFYALATAYGANLESSYSQDSNTFYNNAGPGTTPNFLLAGYYMSSSFNAGGSGGNYWSSTSNSSNNAYNLNFRSSRVISANYSSRKNGFSVRCLKEKDTMQSVTSFDLATLMPNEGDTTTLEDARDGQEYTIAKLADGKYWMLENLRLGSSTDNLILTSNDTNITSTVGSWTLPKSSTTCFYTSSCTNGAGASGTGYTVPAINTDSKDTLVTSYGTAATNGQAKVGVYYNYCAAVAGDPNLCVESNSSSNASSDRDICPKGWKLPTTGSSNNSAGSYYYLYNTSYSANHTNFRNALSTPLSGLFSDGWARYQGSGGNFWSATRNNNTSMYYLYVNSSYVNPAYDNNRYYGNSIRCLLK